MKKTKALASLPYLVSILFLPWWVFSLILINV
uniref:Chloroplast envelope membrane protein n=1 Tax=Limodorum abortivum TaxID=242627 RepID=A0A411GVE3_9ASPA|nr:chloroplast envelope membrane protein [Limodorum abortivum]